MNSHLAALAAALLLATPSAALAQAGSKGAVKVGVLLPLTGNTAWAGKTNRIAATIAAESECARPLRVATRSNSCSATANASRGRRTIRRSA